MSDWTIHQGDALETLRDLPNESTQTCVTSPPYWQLRDYGVDGQIGLEETPTEHVDTLVEVFDEVRRVLREDGTLWLNLGDTYASGGNGWGGSWVDKRDAWESSAHNPGWRSPPEGLKHKDLCGMPWRLAFALQRAGWYLRSDIIWHKTNAMPESVGDRPFKAHEYLFLLSKSEQYYYDADAIKEPVSGGAHSRGDGLHPKCADPDSGVRANTSFSAAISDHLVTERHRRTVWEASVSRYTEAHFATFPPDLVRPCILAGAPEGGTVLDPFAGSGTAGAVAVRHGRRFVGVELNPKYIDLAENRIRQAIEESGQLEAAEAEEHGGQVGLFSGGSS